MMTALVGGAIGIVWVGLCYGVTVWILEKYGRGRF